MKLADLIAQTEFQPDMRLRMPKKAGTGQITQQPSYTGGQPPLQAGTGRRPNVKMKRMFESEEFKARHPERQAEGKKKKHCCAACAKAAELEARGMHRAAAKAKSSCGSHGFAMHKGNAYARQAAEMGHRIPLSASAQKRSILIRQRPSNRRKVGYSFRGYQGVV